MIRHLTSIKDVRNYGGGGSSEKRTFADIGGGGSSKGGRPQKNLKKVKKHELMAKTSNHTYDIQKWAN